MGYYIVVVFVLVYIRESPYPITIPKIEINSFRELNKIYQKLEKIESWNYIVSNKDRKLCFKPLKFKSLLIFHYK